MNVYVGRYDEGRKRERQRQRKRDMRAQYTWVLLCMVCKATYDASNSNGN